MLELAAETPLKWVPVPTVTFAPETSWKFGLAVNYFFRAGGRVDNTLTRESFFILQTTYSLRKQFTLEPQWQVFSKNNIWFSRGRSGFIFFIEPFWGIGNQTAAEQDQSVNITYRRLFVDGKTSYLIRPGWYSGLRVNYGWTYGMEYPEGYRDEFPSYAGDQGSRIGGIGPLVLFDKRNDIYSPTAGYFAEFNFMQYAQWLGSEFDYQDYFIDLRKYFPFGKDQHIGIQGRAELSTGALPFRELKRLGGPESLRGYTLGRYRDRQYVSAQAEYRTPLFWEYFRIAGFIGAGKVAPAVADLNFKDWHRAGGLGVRILFNRKSNLYLRIDAAMNEDSHTAFYFSLGDAF